MTEQPDETPDAGPSQEDADPPEEATEPLDQAVEPSTDVEDAVIEAGAHA